MASLKSENCGQKVLRNTSLFLLSTRVLPASPNFGQAKHGQNRPRSHCLSSVHLLPYMWASFYPLDPSRYLSSFLSWRQKTKKFPFFTNLRVALVKKIRRPAADSILMPPTFPMARLNRYTPNFSGVTQKLTWCQ